MTSIAATIARAGANFRRALVLSLRGEGMQVSGIGLLLEVSRQRVSALLRPSRRELSKTQA